MGNTGQQSNILNKAVFHLLLKEKNAAGYRPVS
jgi:hypothetical protein